MDYLSEILRERVAGQSMPISEDVMKSDILTETLCRGVYSASADVRNFSISWICTLLAQLDIRGVSFLAHGPTSHNRIQ